MLSVVEKSHSGHCHSHAVLVADLNNIIVTNGAAGLCDIGNAALLSSFDVITEGEECIASESNAGNGSKVSLLLSLGKRLGLLGEEGLPYAVCEYVLVFIRNIYVDSIVSVGTLYAVKEGKVKNLVVLTEMPDVSLVTCKTGAVDSGLLTCADTDRLSVLSVANGVTLGVLKSDIL